MITDKLIWLRHQIYNRIVGTVLPVTWFGPEVPERETLNVASKPLHLEIVSHCWQYAHMLNFQLSSLVNHPPTNFKLTYTLFHAAEDTKLKQLISRYDRMQVPGISWQWRELSRQELFRRAIGRNRAATQTQADWIWFSDCDLIFHDNCLHSLATALNGVNEPLVFPDHEFVTELLESEHPMLKQSINEPATIDTSLFTENQIAKAKGAFQIVHGDIARACGYCKEMSMYQKPMQHWSKTYEDSIFRRLIKSEGTPVCIDGLYRIRHREKGRYVKGSPLSRLRKGIRLATDDAGSHQ